MAALIILEISEEDRIYLESLIRSRIIQAQVAQRARILLLKTDGESIDSIADKVGINRKSVMLCIKKYKKRGANNVLYDAPGRGRNPEITDEDVEYVIKVVSAL